MKGDVIVGKLSGKQVSTCAAFDALCDTLSQGDGTLAEILCLRPLGLFAEVRKWLRLEVGVWE